MSPCRISAALGVAVLVSLATTARADAGVPPTTQAAQPGPAKVMIKLIIGSAKPVPDGLAPEPWVIAETQRAGSPYAADGGNWTALGEDSKATKLDTSRLSAGLQLEGQFRRDVRSKLLIVQLGESAGPVSPDSATPAAPAKKKSVMLPDEIGQHDVFKLDAPSGGQTLFVALEVASPKVKPVAAWGDLTEGVRVSLRIQADPGAWSGRPPGGTIQFTCLFENATSNNLFQPFFNMHVTAPLEITNEKGQKVAVQMQPAANKSGIIVGAPPLLPGGATQSTLAGGTYSPSDSTLTITSATGNRFQWKLPPGDYRLRAVGDFHDHPNTGGAGGRLAYSQSVPVEIPIPAPSSQPAGK